MQKFNWKDFENGKIAINCKIEEEAVFFINECLKRNMDWFYIGDDLATYWNLYKEDTTYRNDCEGSKVLQISSKEYFQDEGIPVLDFKDIVKSKKDECGTSTEELAERICRTMKSIGNESTEYLKNDDVIKPNHYKAGEFDVIAFCQKHDLSFDVGNVIKYVTRAGKKKDNSELQDLNKAMEYLRRRIKFIKGE